MKTKDLLAEAIEMITIPLLEMLDFGCEIDLNEGYTLYHYCEEEIIVLVKTEEWEEVLQILYNTEDNSIILESL